MVARPCRRRRPSSLDDGGISGIYRENLMDAVSSFDDDIAMMYLEGEEVPVEMIKAAIRKATIANEMIPVVCGTSYKNKGVQQVLDAVVDPS